MVIGCFIVEAPKRTCIAHACDLQYGQKLQNSALVPDRFGARERVYAGQVPFCQRPSLPQTTHGASLKTPGGSKH